MIDNTEIDEIAEVVAYMISQEKYMTVPPVLIPLEGVTKVRSKKGRNEYYPKQDLKNTHSFNKVDTVAPEMSPFPKELSSNCEIEEFVDESELS